MTQEYKKLLIKDLSARFPYGVIVKVIDTKSMFNAYIDGIRLEVIEITPINIDELDFIPYSFYSIVNIKPYLRPLSSMTEEENKELSDQLNNDELLTGDPSKTIALHCCVVTDFMCKHHFDYRNLIDKSLALIAPEEMYGM